MPEIVSKSGLAVVTHWTGSQRPPAVEQAMRSEGMGWSTPFGPGTPLNPYAGSGKPRSFDYAAGYNIATRPSVRDGRVSFDVLKNIIDSWDLARIAIGHRIDDVRSLDWSLEAARGVTEDVTTAIEYGYAKLKYPEGPGSRLPFRAWVAKFLEGILRYDAGTLYRRRNRAGEVIGLQVVAGVTIAPVLDEYGGTPAPPAPAYLQYIKGYPHRELTLNDLIYVPFRPQDDSPYGFAPLESVLLTANTDLRMQQFFLGHYLSGNVPEGFATTPEGFSPDQINDWQSYWDALLYGDAEALHQIKWVPAGTKFEWSKDWKFDEKFQNFLVTKTAAAFHVTPADMGFTSDVNRATSESQEDINFRIGTLPLVQHVQDILDAYLQEDLGLPIAFRFDTGMDKEDRVSEAQVDKIDIEAGVVSPDEIRQKRGYPIDNKRPVGRFVMHSRRGPIPLLDIISASGKIDGETYGPAADQPELPDPSSIASVIPEERTAGANALLVQDDNAEEAARHALHPEVPLHPPVNPPATPTPSTGTPGPGDAVTEALKAALTAGVTSGTGITGNPLRAGTPDDDLADALTKALGIVKAATVAGLAVKAADTGRVLMLQRALNVGPTTDAEASRATGGEHDDVTEVREDMGLPPLDPAAGRIEFPGGHLEDGETPLQGACREWAEEVGCTPPPGVECGSWESPNGVYQGIVWVIPSEADLTINLDPEDRHVLNPDDPDGDMVETVMWVDPALLAGNPMVRDELAADLDRILPVIDAATLDQDVVKAFRSWRRASRERVVKSRGPRLLDAAGVPEPVRAVVWPVLRGARSKAEVDAAFRRVVKAGKGRWRDGAPKVPQRAYDLRITDHFAPLIQRALGQMYPSAAIRVAAEAGTTSLLPEADTGPLRDVLERLWADAWATGRHGAELQVKSARVRKDDDGSDDAPSASVVTDWSTWEPGNLDAAVLTADGGFARLLDNAGVTIRGISNATLDRVGSVISEGLLDGESVDSIARNLAGVIDDPARAEMISHTETCRAQSLASVDLYQSEGFTRWTWILSDGACPKCVDQESRNPHAVGDGAPPLHPRCRCSVAPDPSSMTS